MSLHRPVLAALLVLGCSETPTSPYVTDRPTGPAGARFDGVYRGRGTPDGPCSTNYTVGRIEVLGGHYFWFFGMVGLSGTLDASGALAQEERGVRLTGTFERHPLSARFTGVQDETGRGGCRFVWEAQRV